MKVKLLISCLLLSLSCEKKPRCVDITASSEDALLYKVLQRHASIDGEVEFNMYCSSFRISDIEVNQGFSEIKHCLDNDFVSISKGELHTRYQSVCVPEIISRIIDSRLEQDKTKNRTLFNSTLQDLYEKLQKETGK